MVFPETGLRRSFRHEARLNSVDERLLGGFSFLLWGEPGLALVFRGW
jgi:hypothetical protein